MPARRIMAHYLVKQAPVETCGLINRDDVEERREVPLAECHLGGSAATRGALLGPGDAELSKR
jgi:hypothetical protein